MSRRRFRHGLVLGKFYPLHVGHSVLIRAALAQCDRVTVQVLTSSVESIPLEVRAAWVREEHPPAHVVAAMDEAEVDFGSASAWDAHMTVIEGLLDAPVDAVFTSDAYGAELAARLSAAWVQVDPGRVTIPVSGTAVRADAEGHWWALGPAVRSWFARRVVVLGAESTGTTTVWHERYLGSRSASVEALAKERVPALYVLTDCDIPFEQDGMRDGEHLRAWMTSRFREVLAAQPAPWIGLRGSREARLAVAVSAVDALLARGWVLADPLG